VNTVRWQRPLMLFFAALLGLLWLYRDTATSLLALWQSSDTYAHGFIIFPISLYLIWQQRDHLFRLTPRPSAWGLIALALLGTGWIIAQSADVQVIAQYMFVAMIPALTVTLLGWRVARTIAFPLAFTLLAVPFGDIFIRPLIDFTADFTVSALQFSGIPVFREGSHLTLVSGSWEVAEACSGLRYLIASFTLGCLYAYLTYRSRLRQAVFIVLSILVPILANGIRAYLIVLLGHISNMTLAVGVDHLIYGWLFFGFVMFLLFWAGSYWREDGDPPLVTLSTLPDHDQAASALNSVGLAVAALFIAWLAPVYLHQLEQRSFNPAPVTLTLPNTLSNWTATSAETGLAPAFPGASSTLQQEYRHNDQIIGIYLAFFRNPQQAGKAVSSQNILAAEHSTTWSVISESTHELHSKPGHVRQTRLIMGNRKMLAWQWYWIDSEQTASPYRAKWLQVKQRLSGDGDDGADIVIYAPHDMRQNEIATIMEEFLNQAAPAIRQSMETAGR